MKIEKITIAQLAQLCKEFICEALEEVDHFEVARDFEKADTIEKINNVMDGYGYTSEEGFVIMLKFFVKTEEK